MPGTIRPGGGCGLGLVSIMYSIICQDLGLVSWGCLARLDGFMGQVEGHAYRCDGKGRSEAMGLWNCTGVSSFGGFGGLLGLCGFWMACAVAVVCMSFSSDLGALFGRLWWFFGVCFSV